jgi:hypothetical protein
VRLARHRPLSYLTPSPSIMSAATSAYDAFVKATALNAGGEAFAVCVVAEESSRYATALGTHSLAVAPRLTKISHASQALAALLFALRTQRAFQVPIGRETVAAIEGACAFLCNASSRLRLANQRVLTSTGRLEGSITALLSSLGSSSSSAADIPAVGEADSLTLRLLQPASGNRCARSSLGLLLFEAALSILKDAHPFIDDWLEACDSEDSLAVGEALQALAAAAGRLAPEEDRTNAVLYDQARRLARS